MLEKFVKALFGSQHERDLKRLLPILHQVNEKESWAASLPVKAYTGITGSFRERYAKGESLDSMLPEAFALAMEASRRILGESPYKDTQRHQPLIAEEFFPNRRTTCSTGHPCVPGGMETNEE